MRDTCVFDISRFSRDILVRSYPKPTEDSILDVGQVTALPIRMRALTGTSPSGYIQRMAGSVYPPAWEDVLVQSLCPSLLVLSQKRLDEAP